MSDGATEGSRAAKARELIEALLDEVEEWHFEDHGGGGERNICFSCGADYPIGKRKKEHKPGCKLARLLAEAASFLEGS